LLGATTSSPYETEPHHPDLFWYGIHGVESLYALLGMGCQRVSCVEGDKECVVVGMWANGRCGVYRGFKNGPSGGAAYTFTVYGTQQVRHIAGFSGYEPLVSKICTFFVTGQPPISSQETIELFAFMEAAQQSKQRLGQAVELDELLDRARAEAAKLTARSDTTSRPGNEQTSPGQDQRD
jgi:hypothetical protein